MTEHPLLKALTRKNVLAGLMFIAIAAFGLWLSRDYNVGTLRRMGTGFMPQALCWLLLGLGATVVVQGLLERPAAIDPADAEQQVTVWQSLWPICVVAASMVAFALTIEWLGLVVAIVLLVLIAGLAYRGLKWWETLVAALVLTALCWAVFVLALGMSVKVLPEL